MPAMFLCIYMYICERSENTRVGANCNSPFHMGEFKNMGEFEMWAICNMGDLRKKHTQQHRANSITYSAAPARGLCPYDTRKKPHANINVQ